MSGLDTTRRSLLRLGTGALAYGAGAAAVAGGFALASEAKGAQLTVSPALSTLLDQFARADAKSRHWHDTVWTPAFQAHEAAIAAVPHVEIPCQAYRNVLDETTPAHVYSTANRHDMARCRGIMSIPLDRQSKDPRWQETYRAARRLTIAGKWRERKIRRLHRAFARLGLAERDHELWAPVYAATTAIVAFPIASAADLLAKIDHMAHVGTCDGNGEEYQAIIREDVERLCTQEARA